MTTAQDLWFELHEVEFDFDKLKTYRIGDHPSVEVEGVGTLTHVEDGVEYDDGAAMWLVFEHNGELFRASGWFDSWGDDGEWNDLDKVERVEVVRHEYKVVK